MKENVYLILKDCGHKRLFLSFTGPVTLSGFLDDSQQILVQKNSGEIYKINWDGSIDSNPNQIVLFPGAYCKDWKLFKKIKTLRIDQVVLVSTNGNIWKVRHFASVSTINSIKVYRDGKNSAGSEADETTSFSYVVLLEDFDFSDYYINKKKSINCWTV